MNALFNLPTTSSSSIQTAMCFGVFDVFDVFDTLSNNKVRCWKLWFWTDTSTWPSDHRPHFPLAHCLGFRRAWRVPKGSVLSPQHTKSSRWAMATWHGGNAKLLTTSWSKVSEVNEGKVDVHVVLSYIHLYPCLLWSGSIQLHWNTMLRLEGRSSGNTEMRKFPWPSVSW